MPPRGLPSMAVWTWSNFLLNVGFIGNVFHGTGFKYATELAEKKGHFAIVNLLKNVTRVEE